MRECKCCGGELPPSKGGRPRKFCSTECRRKGSTEMADDIAGPEEVLRMLTLAARDGAVTAMTSLLKYHEKGRRDDDDEKPGDPFAALDAGDELAEVRRRRAS